MTTPMFMLVLLAFLVTTTTAQGSDGVKAELLEKTLQAQSCGIEFNSSAKTFVAKMLEDVSDSEREAARIEAEAWLEIMSDIGNEGRVSACLFLRRELLKEGML